MFQIPKRENKVVNFTSAKEIMFFPRSSRLFLAGLIPAAPDESDVVSRNTKTYKAFLERPPSKETGWDRTKDIFKVDEFGSMSAELNSVYQAGFLGFLIGVCYGGVNSSKIAYMNFMENNQATAFRTHLDAKRKLQNDFTTNFAVGGFRWGWRLALFTTSYVGIITAISVYRGKSSIYEYLAAGTVTGSLYKVNMGLRGMTAGGVIGGAFGGIAGAVSLLIMHLSGTSMEEVRYWQYKWRVQRDQDISDAFKKSAGEEPELIQKHDDKVKTNKHNLANIK